MSLPFDFSEKQKAIVLACLAIIFLGLGVGLTTFKKAPPSPPVPPVKRTPRLTVTPTPAPASFNLVPSSKILKAGETLSLSVSLSSGALPVDAVDAILLYDPTFFKVEKITPGKIFAQYPIRQFDNKKGKVQLSAAAEIRNGEITSFSGKQEYGLITFRTLKATESAEITWDVNSIVASAGKNRLDLEQSAEGKYIITAE